MKKLITLLTALFICSVTFSGEIPGQKKNIIVESITSTEAIPITAFYPACKTDTVVSGAVTVDWDEGNAHYIVLPSGATTITLANPSELGSGSYRIFLKQPASGASGTFVFSPVPLYSSGVAYVLTVTNSALDMAGFVWDPVNEKYITDVMLDVK